MHSTGRCQRLCLVAGVVLVMAMAIVSTTSDSNRQIRSLDCQMFCKKTGFSGTVGECQCGYMLFGAKRSNWKPSDMAIENSMDRSWKDTSYPWNFPRRTEDDGGLVRRSVQEWPQQI